MQLRVIWRAQFHSKFVTQISNMSWWQKRVGVWRGAVCAVHRHNVRGPTDGLGEGRWRRERLRLACLLLSCTHCSSWLCLLYSSQRLIGPEISWVSKPNHARKRTLLETQEEKYTLANPMWMKHWVFRNWRIIDRNTVFSFTAFIND